MHLLDSIIAFAAVMLIGSLVVTAGTQFAISLLGLRGANLRRSLADLFETACDDADAKRYGKVIANRALRHPLLSGSVFSRFGVRIEGLPFVPADAAGKLRWAGSGIPFQPWLMGALGGFLGWPAALAILKRLAFVDIYALSGIISAYVPFLNFFEHPWRTGAIAGAILGGLLSRWRLATSVRADELVAVLEKLSTPPGGSLPDPAQRAMLVIAGEAQNGSRLKINSAATDFDKFVRELPENDLDDIPVMEERVQKQVPAQTEQRLEGVNSWFDHAMNRASQRFTLQARVITVVLAFVLVFAAHLDAIRLFGMLSSDAQVQLQLTSSADAITKQAGQLSRTHEDGAGKENVPDIYRKAMVDVLASVPVSQSAIEQPKPKSHHSSHHASAAAAIVAPSVASGSPAESSDATQAASQVSADASPAPPVVQAATEAPTKSSGHRSSKSSKAKPAPTEAAKSPAAPVQDKAMMDAKARAGKALESVAGFASREDAASWLRGTLNSDPAAENLVANYEQAVNAQLGSDTDKLLDQAASLKHDLAQSELQLVPGKWLGWKPATGELPGFLVALALLSLGAPICFNLLKGIASLRPPALPVTSLPPDRRIRREDRRQAQAQTREPARAYQPRAQAKVVEKVVEEPEPATSGVSDHGQ